MTGKVVPSPIPNGLGDDNFTSTNKLMIELETKDKVAPRRT
jgi:hypothetical protein